MDDEGKATSKGAGHINMDSLLHPLPARPERSIALNPSPIRLSMKRGTSSSRGSEILKATTLVTTTVSLPSRDNIKGSTLPVLAKDEEEVVNSVEGLEQQPVVPFWDEKDPGEQGQKQSTTSGVKLHRDKSKKLAESWKNPSIERVDITARHPLIFPQGHSLPGVVNKPKWRPLNSPQESNEASGGTEKLHEKVSNGVNPASNHISAIPIGPKHRESTKTFESLKGIHTSRNGSKNAPVDAPRAPRSMLQVITPTTTATQKEVEPLITPASNSLSSLGAPALVNSKVEDPPILEPEEPPNLKPVIPLKEIKDFQTPTSINYSSMVSTFINGAAKDGSPLHIKGFPLCPQQCQITPPTTPDALHEESILRGKLGCTHSASIDLPCLSINLPKEMRVHHFEVLSLQADSSCSMTRVPSGRSLYCQATGDNSEGCLRWYIVTSNNAGPLSKYFTRKGKILESGELVPEPDELLEATKASIAILQCDQGVGDVVYIPTGAWYQRSKVTAVQHPMGLRTWHTYPLKAILTKDITRDVFTFHRLCYPATPPVRTMIYHYLRAFGESISDTASTTHLCKNKRQENEQLQNLLEAIKLFDRILTEEYTQGTREEESHLKNPGFCDFCGTDIFHAAFVCSSKFGLWERSPISGSCCEVQICPSCCSEGRSCLCGKLRLCTVFDFDELVKMRNQIWGWCITRRPNLDPSGEITRTLTTYDIYGDLRHPHLTLGAISILNIRNSGWMEEKYSPEVSNLIVTCKGGALCCEEHNVSHLESVTCASCHETICFKHILSTGIHSWEAAFRWEHDRSWHQVHSAWSSQWIKWSKNNVSDPEDLLTILASTFVSCKPLKPANVRLGFYDTADPSLNCAKYEDDPLLRWSKDKFSNTDPLIPSIELMAPAIKVLKSFKRKSETPGAGDSSDTRTVKRKKRNANRDGAFNPKPSQRKGTTTKASKTKSRLGASTPVTPVKDEDDSIDDIDVSMDLSQSLRLASRALLLDELGDTGILRFEESESRSSPETTHLGAPVSVDTSMVMHAATFSGPPSTTRSSFECSPEQSSSIVTPVELLYSNGNKDEMVLLRQQMESLLRENENLHRKVIELQQDKDLQMQAKDLEITRLAERVSALEAGASAAMTISPQKTTPVEEFDLRNASSSSKPADGNPSMSDTESEDESDTEGNLMTLVPY